MKRSTAADRLAGRCDDAAAISVGYRCIASVLANTKCSGTFPSPEHKRPRDSLKIPLDSVGIPSALGPDV